MQKQAFKVPGLVKDIGTGLLGVGVGGAVGSQVNPRLFGYQDVPEARTASGVTDAILGAALAVMARHGKLPRLSEMNPKTLLAIPAGYIASATIVPHVIKSQRAAVTASNAVERGAQISAKATQDASIPAATEHFFRHPATVGAGVGAAGAGLAAILTGLARKRSEEEMKNRTSRMGMIGSDALKYILPAMVAGGVVGSFTGK